MTGLSQFKAGLIGAEQHLLGQATLAVFVVDGYGAIAHRFNLDDTNNFVALYASDLSVFFDVFEFNHAPSLVIWLLWL